MDTIVSWNLKEYLCLALLDVKFIRILKLVLELELVRKFGISANMCTSVFVFVFPFGKFELEFE